MPRYTGLVMNKGVWSKAQTIDLLPLTAILQWNPYNPDTLVTIPPVMISGVKYCTNGSLGAATGVPIIEVSLCQSVLTPHLQ